MATVKEIKAELDACGVEYPSKAKKAGLAAMLAEYRRNIDVDEERPRNIKAERPAYIDAVDDFVDPNARPGTQAE